MKNSFYYGMAIIILFFGMAIGFGAAMSAEYDAVKKGFISIGEKYYILKEATIVEIDN